jgi:hypothetical protein
VFRKNSRSSEASGRSLICRSFRPISI